MIKRAFYQSKERIINHLSEPFGKGMIHKKSGRPLNEVLREKSFASPGVPLINVEIPDNLRIRKTANNRSLNQEKPHDVNGKGDHVKQDPVIDPYERELTREERREIRKEQKREAIE